VAAAAAAVVVAVAAVVVVAAAAAAADDGDALEGKCFTSCYLLSKTVCACAEATHFPSTKRCSQKNLFSLTVSYQWDR